MNNGPYTVMQNIQVTFTFHNFDDSLVDPSTVNLLWRSPSGVESAADSSAHTGLGTWTSTKLAASAGSWVARAETTGAVRAPKEVFCWVAPSMYTNPA